MEQALFDYLAPYITLTDAEKAAILALDLFKSYPKGATLLQAGQLSDNYFFVLKGCIRCYYLIDGEERTTAFYTELESFIPLCSVDKQPSEYYAACVEDSVVLVANHAMERRLLEEFPRFETLCHTMSEEMMVKKQASFDDFKTSTPEQRYLKLLHTRPDLVQRVPQHQLASFLGIKPQSLSRIRKRLASTRAQPVLQVERS